MSGSTTQALPQEAAAPRVAARETAREREGGSERIVSVDVLRGLTILVMIFVNDLAGVRGVPAWMKHVEPPTADGMTFVDVVFPAFLTIVGISIPFALERRLAREPRWRALAHVLTRALALLVIGVFMVNSGGAAEAGPLPPELWVLLLYAGVVLVWLAPPRAWALGTATQRAVRLAGVAVLLAAALLYRGPGEPALIELRPSWWGILGLICWAYLVASTLYLLFRRQMAALVGCVALLYLVFVAHAAGAFAGLTWVNRWVSIGPMLGSHAALTLSGVLLLLPGSPVQGQVARLRWALGAGAFFAVAALLLHSARAVHPLFIVNKIAATPAWCLWSAALTFWLWAAVYWLLDVKRRRGWASLLEAAGQNALLAYILAPIVYAAFALAARALAVPNPYGLLSASFAGGFARALVFALLVVAAAGVLRRKGFVLKL